MATFIQVDMRAAVIIGLVGSVVTLALLAPDQFAGFLEGIMAAITGAY